MSRKTGLQKLITEHNRHLQLLREKEAKMGIATPPHILIEIEDYEEKLEVLKTELVALEMQDSANEPTVAILEAPYGTMPPDSPFYIERKVDNDCWLYLSQEQAATIFVQAPRQMGKSSLIRQLTHRVAQSDDRATAFVDFEKFTEQQFDNLREFLISFCVMIGDALGVPEATDKYWGSSRRSELVACTNNMKYFIETHSQPFILAMDEVERLLTKPMRNDFFGMLRTWHNDRSWDATLAQMTILLSSSTEPHLFIDNPNQSPFNVADPIVLRDFRYAEVVELNQRHPSPLPTPQLETLMDLLSGHPFLTRLALYLLNTNRTDFETLMTEATADTGPFGDHLRRYWQHIIDHEDLKTALRQVCREQNYPEDKLYYRLKGAGLIISVGSRVVMRNQLYQRYFLERL